MHRTDWVLKAVMLTVLAVAVTAIWLVLRALGMPDSLSAGAISAWLNSQGALGPLLLALMMIVAVVVGPIPTLPVSAASGLAFGIVGGTLVAATGALAGALVAFHMARLLGREALRKKLNNHPVFAEDGSQRALFWVIFVTRLVPLFSFALVSYAAGVTAITAWRFAIASFLGMLPMTVVFAGLGQTLELHPLLTVAAAAIVLGLIVLLPYYLGRRFDSVIARWLKAEE